MAECIAGSLRIIRDIGCKSIPLFGYARAYIHDYVDCLSINGLNLVAMRRVRALWPRHKLLIANETHFVLTSFQSHRILFVAVLQGQVVRRICIV